MLIATLPTITEMQSLGVATNIIAHPLINAVRYNSGGDSPLSPYEILAKLKFIADQYGKQLYIDLEGRQTRIAHWTPSERGSIEVNRNFSITLPAKVYVRNVGWFDVVNAVPENKKFYLSPKDGLRDYYFGESQSVHVVAKQFEVRGYLGGRDVEYINAAVSLGLRNFMLSFVESSDDVDEFYDAYYANKPGKSFRKANVVLKIESVRGVEFVKRFGKKVLSAFHLMAARDDLFISFVDQEANVIDALRLIAERDNDAIVASRIFSGLEYRGEIALSDIEDILLMQSFGYQRFMLSDGLVNKFSQTIEAWERTVMPMLEKEGKRK